MDGTTSRVRQQHSPMAACEPGDLVAEELAAAQAGDNELPEMAASVTGLLDAALALHLSNKQQRKVVLGVLHRVHQRCAAQVQAEVNGWGHAQLSAVSVCCPALPCSVGLSGHLSGCRWKAAGRDAGRPPYDFFQPNEVAARTAWFLLRDVHRLFGNARVKTMPAPALLLRSLLLFCPLLTSVVFFSMVHCTRPLPLAPRQPSLCTFWPALPI